MPSFRSLLCVAIAALLAASVSAESPAEANTRTMIGSRSTLNDPTGLVNKNMAASGNNIAITRSNVIAKQDDVADIETEAQSEKDVDAERQRAPIDTTKQVPSQLPWDLTLTGERDTLTAPEDSPKEQFYGYRHRFYYPHFRGGYYGWRYPMSYWNYYGPRYYGGYCPFGRSYGSYYYC